MSSIRIVIGTAAVGAGVALMSAPAWAGAGCFEDASVAESTLVKLRGNCFVGTVTRAPAGEPITFVNRDKVPHTVTGVGWDGGELPGLGETRLRFPEDGIYVYTCIYHPGMSGALVIGDPDGGAATGSPVEMAPPGEPDEASAVSAPTSTGVPMVGAVVGLVGAGLGFELGRRRRR